MGKRTVLALFVVMVIGLGLVGCGSSGASSSQAATSSSSEASQQSQEASSASSVAVSQNPDEEFLPALAAALEARWELATKTEGQEITPQQRKELADAELEHLAAFKGASFEDAELGQLAERYIAAIEESVACLESYDTDYVDFAERWSNAYKERALVIKDLIDRYGFKMSDEHQASLDGMVADAKEAEEEKLVPADIRQTVEEDIPAMVASAFQKDGDTYRATVVNPGPVNFDYYDLTVCLLNAQGGLVEDHVIHFDSWPAGAEAVFEFTPSSEFSSIATIPAKWHGTWYTS